MAAAEVSCSRERGTSALALQEALVPLLERHRCRVLEQVSSMAAFVIQGFAVVVHLTNKHSCLQTCDRGTVAERVAAASAAQSLCRCVVHDLSVRSLHLL